MSLETFREWAETKTDELMSTCINTAITICPPTENSAATFDFSTSKYEARITYWESGDSEAEILDVTSGRQIFYYGKKFLDANFDRHFEAFFELLRS